MPSTWVAPMDHEGFTGYQVSAPLGHVGQRSSNMHLALKKMTQPWQLLWLCCVGSIKTCGDLLGSIGIELCVLRRFTAFYSVFIVVSCNVNYFFKLRLQGAFTVTSSRAECLYCWCNWWWCLHLPGRVPWESLVEKRCWIFDLKSSGNSKNSLDSAAAARKRLRSDLQASALKTFEPWSPEHEIETTMVTVWFIYIYIYI